MSKCFYCDDKTTDDDLTLVDGQWIRVCADCRDFIEKYGTDLLNNSVMPDEVKETKAYIRRKYEPFGLQPTPPLSTVDYASDW